MLRGFSQVLGHNYFLLHLAFIIHINPIVDAEIFSSVFCIMLYKHKKTPKYGNKSHRRNAVRQICVLL